ncbi:MAG: ABC transporter ATP-binding protein [Anaerolineae bacterium]|nr:ABC transporter ATP-binding protein [Anaerolineae bacterium]
MQTATLPAIIVETQNLTKIYGNGYQVRALDGVSLCVHAGEFVAVVGPSGSGKSTLLNMIGALDRPTSGEVIIDGAPLSKVRDLDRFRSETIGFIFQTHNLIPTLTALENVETPTYELPLRGRERRRRAEDILRLVGLGERMTFLPAQLSGGERQRVAIARALVNRPAIVLADEPTGMLDSHTTQDIMDLLTQLNRSQGTTIIVVTHNHEVARATRRVVTFRDGQIQADVPLKNAFDSDLYDLKASSLGHALLSGDALPSDLQEIAPQLRDILARV